MHQIVIQLAVEKQLAPKKSLLQQWAKQALSSRVAASEVTIRIVDVAEMTTLNETFRHKVGPTNVLSFPYELPKEIADEKTVLGDIIICAEIVDKEAQEQTKVREAHWAHMVVHGVFHLLGYDHMTDSEAEIMEGLEIAVMKQLGFANPYDTGSIKTHD